MRIQQRTPPDLYQEKTSFIFYNVRPLFKQQQEDVNEDNELELLFENRIN